MQVSMVSNCPYGRSLAGMVSPNQAKFVQGGTRPWLLCRLKPRKGPPRLVDRDSRAIQRPLDFAACQLAGCRQTAEDQLGVSDGRAARDTGRDQLNRLLDGRACGAGHSRVSVHSACRQRVCPIRLDADGRPHAVPHPDGRTERIACPLQLALTAYMTLLEQEIWIAQFAALLQDRAPTYPRAMALDIGAYVWPCTGLLPPAEGVIRFLEVLAEASADLRQRAEIVAPAEAHEPRPK